MQPRGVRVSQGSYGRSPGGIRTPARARPLGRRLRWRMTDRTPTLFAERIEKLGIRFGLNSREIGHRLWTEFMEWNSIRIHLI